MFLMIWFILKDKHGICRWIYMHALQSELSPQSWAFRAQIICLSDMRWVWQEFWSHSIDYMKVQHVTLLKSSKIFVYVKAKVREITSDDENKSYVVLMIWCVISKKWANIWSCGCLKKPWGHLFLGGYLYLSEWNDGVEL